MIGEKQFDWDDKEGRLKMGKMRTVGKGRGEWRGRKRRGAEGREDEGRRVKARKEERMREW